MKANHTPKDDRMTRGIARAFEIVGDMIEHPEKYDEHAVVIAPDQVAEVFTPERARLHMVLQERGLVESVSKLADLLGRPVSAVSRDVTYLEGFGLLRLERRGKEKRVVAERKPVIVA